MDLPSQTTEWAKRDHARSSDINPATLRPYDPAKVWPNTPPKKPVDFGLLHTSDPEPVKLGLIARTLQAEADRDEYALRLRDIATMAQADTDPVLEMQARAALHALNAPLLAPKPTGQFPIIAPGTFREAT